MSSFYLCCACHMTAQDIEEHCNSCIEYCRTTQKRSQNLRIVAAAVERDGVVFTGQRHGHIIRDMVEMGFLTDKKKPVQAEEQGFVASDGKAYSRRAAREIAIRSGQIKPDHGTLYSEDLW